MLRNTGAAALTPPGSPPTYKAYLRPYWFIQRDNGAYVPVIPVDELPPDIDLEEAPRCLNMDDAQGMKFLGKLAFSGQTYSLAHRTCSQTGLRPLILGSTTLPREAPADDAHGRPHSDAKTLKALTSSSPVSTTITRPLPPSGREPDHSKKEYCTYWIRTGECDFTQQGCLFKHEMPDLKTLREKIGISSVPHWYQVKTAIERRKQMDLDAAAGDSVRKGVGETPRWLNDVVRKNAQEQQDAVSDSGSSDGEEEEVLTPPSSNTSPNSATMASNPIANTATRVASTPRLFRAPDFEVRRRKERTARQADELDRDDISLIDFSSAPHPPAPVAATKPFLPSSSNRHQALKPLPRPPSVARATRSISDAQADIVNLMQHSSRTASSPGLENKSNHNKRHSEPPATTTTTSSKLNFTTTTTTTATKRKSSALPQMKRYFAPLPTTTTTTSSPTPAPTPTAKEKEKAQPRAATPAPTSIRATGLRASRHAPPPPPLPPSPPPPPPPPPPPSVSNSVIDDDDDDGFAPMSVFADQRRRRRLLEELGMREEEGRSGGGGQGQGLGGPAAPAAAYIKAGGRVTRRRSGGGGGGGAAATMMTTMTTKVPVKAGGGGGAASGALGAAAAAVRGRKARARQVVV
ncbi:Zinc finger CCCH-type protein [Lasiodiplodia theobromae]|uniref:Zinc finger CCCH-type protein n=1 Tax=Lasiodiplodia theobromae TaxID=45133 RepID=A0A8H7IQG2_9PEZI|nr:Zinc finger CCCH-type protein [Lasiodiplodia theobromae]